MSRSPSVSKSPQAREEPDRSTIPASASANVGPSVTGVVRKLNGPFVAFLCSDKANYVTGQIFGTGAERIAMVNQPKYGTQMLKPGGWQVEDILEHFQKNLGKQLEDFGLMKTPYPFYDGVPPQPKS